MTEPVDKSEIEAEGQPLAQVAADQAKPIADEGAEPKTPDAEIWRDTAPTVTRPRKWRGPPLPALLIVGVIILALLALIVWRVVAVTTHHSEAGAASPLTANSAPAAGVAAGPLAVYAKGSLAHLVTLATPQAITDIGFIDRDKKPVKLSDFKGQVVILNVWATWCAPCRFEMPTLAKLQADNAGKALKVLPLSVDTEDKFGDVKSFIDVQQPLDVYADQNFAAPQAFNIAGMPTTLILDKQGREVARLDGEATWDTPEVQTLINHLLSE
ncbi:TlpA family protein disulfide reductase [Asticcacaulis sp. EMRT-3]|uniref:TlpA family protein disulfide reductase n=1 Tax=Asticcacaulis sp. EMRT-3 TaxID=3040349 RepID=UPI0024AF2425|nr:TlpA family protein disulfide reductase [Asticcacaulis sp. EMRT-3]MDI7776049.1 redoxin family protein [Asticcacaulis sp. EMRT-3]